MHRFASLGLVAGLLCLASMAHAQPIAVTYDFTGAPGNQLSTAPVGASVPAGMSAGVLSRGGGISTTAGASSINSSNFTTAGVVDINDFYTLTLAPDAGNFLTLTSLVFTERRSGTGIRNIAVRSSLDGFASDVATISVPDTTSSRRQTVTLGAPFASLTAAVTLRLYGYAAENTLGTWRLGGATTGSGHPDNLIVNGSLVVAPEPGALALTGLGLIALGALVRRRRR